MTDQPRVRIVADSACDLPADIADRLDVTIVPSLVRFGTDEFQDRVELSVDDFWRRCAGADELPQTAAPSGGVYAHAYRRLAESGATEIVAVMLSGELSATIASARAGADEAADAVAVRVVDSRGVSMAQGTLVMLAAQLAADGATGAEIETAVTAAVGRTHLHAALDTLENLRKGGRIGAAASLLGSALSIKPLIKIADGVVVADGRQRTRGRALSHLVSLVAERGDDIEHLSVLHAACDDVDEFVARVAPLVPDEVTVADVGPVVGAHAGIRAIGVAFRTRA